MGRQDTDRDKSPQPHSRRKRILFLSAYPTDAAGTRFRISAYLPYFREHGFVVDLVPFVDNDFFASFYAPGGQFKKARGLLAASVSRLLLLISARSYDAVFVQREAAFLGPEVIERVLTRGFRLPLIFDFDDAIWLPPAQVGATGSRHPLAARLLKAPNKTYRLLRMASQVIAGSSYLASVAKDYNQNITTIPTVVGRNQFYPLSGRLTGAFASEDTSPIVGWIGTHSTARYLEVVLSALKRLARDGERFRLRVIGAGKEIHVPGVEVDQPPWSADREVEAFQHLDIGLAPSEVNEWTEGKCAFKQLQYMATGVPSVCTLVGGGRDFLRHGENTLIAESEEDWYHHIKMLLHDQALRARLSISARQLVEEEYCIEVQAPRVLHVVQRALCAPASDSANARIFERPR